MESSGRVVVGMDGSESSLTAVRWAAGEADLRPTKRLHVVMASGDPMWDDEAWEVLGPVNDQIAGDHPSLEVSSDVVPGDPADVLLQLSDGAVLVAVGSRGRSTLAATLLGSVSAKVATHARCPVVVVRERRYRGPVVVGLDNSPHSGSALRYAFDAASRYESELVAMHVWQDIEYAPVVPRLEYELADLRDEALRRVAEQLAGCAESYPNVPVRKVAQRGHPVAELAAAAEDARLLVVGHRGRGGFTGLLLGSVAAGVLQHAPCPVAVVRGARG